MFKGNQFQAVLIGAIAMAVAAALLAGCGDSSDQSTAPTGADARSTAADFPAVKGRSLEQIATDEGSESDLVAAPSGQVFHVGENRYGFGVFNIDGTPVNDADIALYAAPADKPDETAVGPFPAAAESLAVDAAFQSQTSSTDPDAATTVYAANVDLDSKGEWRLVALVKDGDSYGYTQLNQGAVVGADSKVPAVGDKAPVIHTETADDVGGDIAKIDTRQPPTTMHEDDFADVVGKEPVVLLFATPALCQSRVCGPVADITEQVKDERPDDASYILQEIYKDNSVDKGVRPQVKDYNLPSEPWLFVIGADGKISTEIEGAFSQGELEAALDKVN